MEEFFLFCSLISIFYDIDIRFVSFKSPLTEYLVPPPEEVGDVLDQGLLYDHEGGGHLKRVVVGIQSL